MTQKKMIRFWMAAIIVVGAAPATGAMPVWTDHGANPVLARGAPGTWNAHQIEYPAVTYDGAMLRMYSMGQSAPGASPTIGLAASIDSENWAEYEANSLLAHQTPAVYHDGTEYKLYFNDGTNIGLATSCDGIHWTEHASNPVLVTGSGWEAHSIYPTTILWDGAVYHMWYYGASSGLIRSIGHATSGDGVTWAKDGANPVLVPGAPGAPDDFLVWAPAVVWNGSEYEMWYGGTESESGPHKIGYATSPDGSSWTKCGFVPNLTGVATSVLLRNGAYEMWYGADGDIHYATGVPSASTASRWPFDADYLDANGHHDGTPAAGAGFSASILKEGSHSLDVTAEGSRVTFGPTLLDQSCGTLECWIHPTSWEKDPTASSGTLFDKADPSDIHFRVSYDTTATPDVLVVHMGGTLTPEMAVIPCDIPVGTWTHLAISWDGSMVDVYKDGAWVGADSMLSNPAGGAGTIVSFGAAWDGGDDFDGYLDDVRFSPSAGPPIVTAVTGGMSPVHGLRLDKNRPNPFNPATTISFHLEERGEYTLRVYDMTGRRVREYSRIGGPGDEALVWDGKNDAGRAVGSGTYFYRLEMGSRAETRQMTLIR